MRVPDEPKKDWVYFALNKHVTIILLTLVEEKINSRRFNRRVKNDLDVLRVMLMTSLNRELILFDSEES